MSITDDFYAKFPSLNVNSKENQRFKRISREHEDFIKVKKKEIKEKKGVAQTNIYDDDSTGSRSSSLKDNILFSAEERNKKEAELIAEKRRSYQKILADQIAQDSLKKQLRLLEEARMEQLLEERLQKQIESIKLERKDPIYEKIVERVSLSENEMEKVNKKEKHHKAQSQTHPMNTNNHVYKYFSNSSMKKTDSALFNYRQKYFKDLWLEGDEHDNSKKENHHLDKWINPEVATDKDDYDSSNCTNCNCAAECSKCHRKIDIVCKECSRNEEKPSKEIKTLQIEYNEPYKDQQVIFYGSTQHAPFSFNIQNNSLFHQDDLDNLRDYNQSKLSNYKKLYGDLKRKKNGKILPQRLKENLDIKEEDEIHKLTPVEEGSVNLDGLIGNVQYTVITGYVKKMLGKM